MLKQSNAHKLTALICFSALFMMFANSTGKFNPPSKQQERRTIFSKQGKLGTLFATSAGISLRKTYSVLYWNPVEGAAGYNLYRKVLNDDAFPRNPINGKKLITSVSTCDELKAIIPEGSTEWELLKNAFSSLVSSAKTGTDSKASKSAYAKSDKSIVHLQQKPIQKQMQQLEAVKLMPAANIGQLKMFPLLFYLNLCNVFDSELTKEQQILFDLLAMTNLKIRRARGWAYIDQKVTPEQHYVYQLKAVDKQGQVLGSAQSDVIWAGHFILPDPPDSLVATPGDTKMLLTWKRNPYAFSYMVQRSTSPSGTYKACNEKSIIYDIVQDLNGDSLDTPKPGFVDFQRWNVQGDPIYHHVGSDSLDGPKNYTAYYYKVASRDILERTGTWSGYAYDTPTDKTPPKVPSDLKVNPYFSSIDTGLALSWRKVTQDINSHNEQDITHTYWIFRADTLDDLENLDTLTTASPLYVHILTANPQDGVTHTLSWTDTNPNLVPAYGEKDFYYRIICIDAHNNESAPSAAIGGRVLDTKPPGPTKVIASEGFSDHIRVMWIPNAEPDLGGYQIYRSLCDFGAPYQPGVKDQDLKKVVERLPCDFFLVGEVLKKEADKRLVDTGQLYFDDFSLDEGSPVCYAYWVRAFDMARNLYPGKWANNCPDVGEYICQRLYEEEPPPVPVISALKAKNNAVAVEWISSPIQDLKAFHIYRSENEMDKPSFVRCVWKDGTVHSSPWEGLKPSCGDIPAEADPQTVAGAYLDTTVLPNTIYWYRVSALDWLGNESEGKDLVKIPAVSTFSFSKDLPKTPVLLPPSVSTITPDCGLVVKWTPIYDSSKFGGFIVFRSISMSGPYRQVSAIVKANEFVDQETHRGTPYWYRIQSIDKKGKLSEPSVPMKHNY